MGSFPSWVISGWRTEGSIFDERKRTEPSAKATLKPSGENPPRRGIALKSTTGMSSGLVQGILRSASTTMMVLLNPSTISVSFEPLLPLSEGNRVFGPPFLNGRVRTK